MTNLTQPANQYNSDKGDRAGCCHCYANLYDQIFEPFPQEEISFLEIGLQREASQHASDCPSLRMWLECFPKATVNGFDIADFSNVELPQARIFQGDQGNVADLERVAAEEAGPFDVIINDGSHASFSHPLASEASGAKRRWWLKDALRSLIKGKKRYTDRRLFKLIILEKSLPGNATQCETVSAQTLCNATPSQCAPRKQSPK
jgi:hypothetical protein